MKLLACSVYDKAVQAFMPVFFVRAKGEAIRMFTGEVNKSGSQFAANPGDFDLFVCGEFDDVNGSFSVDASLPLRVLSGLDVEPAR